MKSLRTYVVVDRIAEKVIGAFPAHSRQMALKIFKENIVENAKLKYSEDQYGLYVSPHVYDEYETYDEVLDHCSEETFVDTVKV